ncbi:MAG: SPASM domain-containing protein [Bacteroidales bacterium]|jgi:radical SAM protein with 4Fe4S-binding SPASM domain|nr:SPASM domain-containing protein [Bacteroidales bacterium]
MFDINFYRKIEPLRVRLEKGEVFEKEWLLDQLESTRDKRPIIYNVETTNACNMRCEMCPRTTMMTRKIVTMKPELFKKIVDQIEPHKQEDWKLWEDFVISRYGILPAEMSENHFFLYIIPKVIQLHGYGDPLLDKNMPLYAKLLKEKGFQSYFSCNPSNIDMERTTIMFENGLDYIKYSIETIDDILHKKIRGKASNFTDSYKKILKLLDQKSRTNFNTTIIITMLDLHRPDQEEDFEKLKKAFEGCDVYLYFKSEDQQWYRKDYHGTTSVHWSEFCKHPWMSMTIKSDGEATMCMEDFNNEIILGNTRTESLSDIWNGEKYQQFRRDHVELNKDIKCVMQCDMSMVGHYFKPKKKADSGRTA